MLFQNRVDHHNPCQQADDHRPEIGDRSRSSRDARATLTEGRPSTDIYPAVESPGPLSQPWVQRFGRGNLTQ